MFIVTDLVSLSIFSFIFWFSRLPKTVLVMTVVLKSMEAVTMILILWTGKYIEDLTLLLMYFM